MNAKERTTSFIPNDLNYVFLQQLHATFKLNHPYSKISQSQILNLALKPLRLKANKAGDLDSYAEELLDEF